MSEAPSSAGPSDHCRTTNAGQIGTPHTGSGGHPRSGPGSAVPIWDPVPMPAYLVVNSNITDAAKLDEYFKAVGPTLAGREFKVLVATADAETVEGTAAGERLVVMEFPDRAALRAWYDSPGYQEARKLRLAGTEGFAVIADGL